MPARMLSHVLHDAGVSLIVGTLASIGLSLWTPVAGLAGLLLVAIAEWRHERRRPRLAVVPVPRRRQFDTRYERRREK